MSQPTTMWKVTNTGIYEKVIIKIRGKCVFYFRTNEIRGSIRQQKESLHTRFHDWFEDKQEALKCYNNRKNVFNRNERIENDYS
jgi:hypothetical protein